MSERAFAFRPWLLAALLRPLLFGVAIFAAGIVKQALAAAFLPPRGRARWLSVEEWGVPGPGDIIEGRWTEKERA
jgi:hypothetical protein